MQACCSVPHLTEWQAGVSGLGVVLLLIISRGATLIIGVVLLGWCHTSSVIGARRAAGRLAAHFSAVRAVPLPVGCMCCRQEDLNLH